MSASNVSIAESTGEVNPLEREFPTSEAQADAMWKRIVDLQPLITRTARYMASRYSGDADELAQHMTLSLYEKAQTRPTLLHQCDAFIAKTIKNEIHSYYRHLYGARFQHQTTCIEDLEDSLADDASPDDDLERQERAQALRAALADLDDEECRALINGILKAGNEIFYQNKNTRRPCNVARLARIAHMDVKRAYAVMDRLALRLAMVPALA